MPTEVVESPLTRPSTAELVREFGDEYLSIQSLFRFCFVPGGRLSLLKELAVPEDWGDNQFVLLKYLAVQLRLAVEQGRYVWNGDQMVLTAGGLTTPLGGPIYVGLVPNNTPEENPWVLNWVGERPSCPELPEPPNLGEWPPLTPDHEIVIAFDLNPEEPKYVFEGMTEAPLITQVSALTGALHWSLHRNLGVRQIHAGGRGYFLPLYLKERTDLDREPDWVAPVVVQERRILVRTLLSPEVAYTPARAVANRCEELPSWLMDAWLRSQDRESDRARDAERTPSVEAGTSSA